MNAQVPERKNTILIKLIIGFFILMFLMTLLAGRINNLLMPEVVTAYVMPNNIRNRVETKGNFYYNEEDHILSPVSGYVVDLLVEAGEFISSNEPVLSLNIDDLSLQEENKQIDIKNLDSEARKDDYNNRLHAKKLSNSIELTKQKLEINELRKQTLEKEIATLEKEEIMDLDYDIEKYKIEVEKVQEEYAKNKELFKSGAISKSELDFSKEALDSYTLQYKKLINTKTVELGKKNKTIEDKKLSLEAILLDIHSAKLELEELQEELAFIRSEESSNPFRKKQYTDQLMEIQELLHNEGIIKSPHEGEVSYIGVDQNGRIEENQILFTISNPREDARIEWSLSDEEGKLFDIGDTVEAKIRVINMEDEVENKEEDINAVLHISEKHYNASENNYRYIALIDQEYDQYAMHNGEVMDLIITSIVEEYPYVIPKEAVNFTNNTQGYVFVVMERKRNLGTENYVKKVPVAIEAYDDLYVALGSIMYDGCPVVIQTDRALEDNIGVKVHENNE